MDIINNSFSWKFFYTNGNFVEKETLPKEYIFIFFTFLLVGVLVLDDYLSIRFNRLTVIIILFVSYLILISIFTSSSVLGVLILIGFLSLFVFFLKAASIPSKYINNVIVILCSLQAGYGLLQYFNLIRSGSSFPIVGSYDNPAGFAACLAVAFPIIFTLFKYSRLYKLLAILAVIIIGIAIILSESRAGIVGVITVSFIFFAYKLPNQLKRYKKYLLPSIILVGIISFVFLVYLKKDSASGRLLIWQVTWEMIKDNSISGGGSGSFIANYMEYQADYFIHNSGSKYVLLADNALHPFNEYLLLFVEYEMIGGILLMAGIVALFKLNKLSSPYLLSLVSLGVFSLFSYPLKYPFVWVITAYCLAQISKGNCSMFHIQVPMKVWFKSLIVIISIMGLFFLIRNVKFEYKWNKVAKNSLLGKTKEMLPQYEELNQSWNGNHLFIYNYGAELNHAKEYKKSIEIFNQCTQYWNDYDIQMIMANNYFNLKRWNDAEQHYILASNMCPNRFIPLYQLSEIYEETKQLSKLENIIYKILEKPIKIESQTVDKIITDTKKKRERLDGHLHK